MDSIWQLKLQNRQLALISRICDLDDSLSSGSMRKGNLNIVQDLLMELTLEKVNVCQRNADVLHPGDQCAYMCVTEPTTGVRDRHHRGAQPEQRGQEVGDTCSPRAQKHYPL